LRNAMHSAKGKKEINRRNGRARLTAAQQVGQLGDVRSDPPRFNAGVGTSVADTAQDLDTSRHAQLADEVPPRFAGRCQRVDPIALALVEPTKSQR